jgi:hypothetical protein
VLFADGGEPALQVPFHLRTDSMANASWPYRRNPFEAREHFPARFLAAKSHDAKPARTLGVAARRQSVWFNL